MACRSSQIHVVRGKIWKNWREGVIICLRTLISMSENQGGDERMHSKNLEDTELWKAYKTKINSEDRRSLWVFRGRQLEKLCCNIFLTLRIN